MADITRTGTGSPEGVVSAPPGDLYCDEQGNYYIKRTGTGNTGWYLDEDSSFKNQANGYAGLDGSAKLADAQVAQSNVTQHEAAINHDALTNHDVGQHRTINDAGTGTTELWSANKIDAVTSSISAGMDLKGSVATTTFGLGNITLSGEQTLNGLLTSASRVLVVEQTAGQDNGIYVTAAGAWTRAADSDTDAEVTNGNITHVNDSGSTDYKSKYLLVTADPITVGTTVQTWERQRHIDFGTAAGQAAEGNDSRIPSQDENDALVGTNGAPSTSNKYVTNSDPRNTDARTPTAHSHAGADITSGTVAEARLPVASTTAKGVVELATDGESAANVAVQGNDARMSDKRTAKDLGTTGAAVNVDAAAPPTTGQVLKATSATTATWQTPASSAGLVQTKYKEITVDTTTNDTTWGTVLLTDSITTGANEIIVTFTASLCNSAGGRVSLFRLLVDGSEKKNIGVFMKDAGDERPRTVTLLWKGSVTAAAHTVNIEWRCTGGTMKIRPVAENDFESASMLIEEVSV